MAFLPELLEKIKFFPVLLADFFRGLLEKIARTALWKKIHDFVHGAAERLFEKIPEEKRRWVIAGFFGGIAVLTLFITGVTLIAETKRQPDAPPRIPSLTQQIIPPEELFLPEEPDFVPGVILGREQRSVWTVEDAAPWWNDPLKNGEEPWRSRLEAAIDELMETVP